MRPRPAWRARQSAFSAARSTSATWKRSSRTPTCGSTQPRRKSSSISASGRIDAQISDSIQALEGFLDKPEGKDYAFLGGDQFDLECHGEGAGIAVRKGETELIAALNKAIKEIRDDGSYAAVNARYFDFDILRRLGGRSPLRLAG